MFRGHPQICKAPPYKNIFLLLCLKHVLSSSHLQSHFYFNRLPKLWNKLPPIDLTLSSECIKHVIFKYLWSHFIKNFTSDNPCTYHFSCPCNKCSAMPSSFRPTYFLYSSGIIFLFLFLCMSIRPILINVLFLVTSLLKFHCLIKKLIIMTSLHYFH